MLEQILDFISQLTPFWIYVTLFFFSYIENVFPPTPSDLVILVGGSLVGIDTIHFVPTLLLTTIGSVFGFMTLFFIGSQLDRRVVKAGKIKFVSIEAVEKVENWFTKYGYFIITANRFLPGTRSVISFFAGLSELDAKKTAMLAGLSALFWNAIIIYLGIIFGKNIHDVDYYLDTYSNIVLTVTIVIILFFVIRYFIQKKKKNSH